MEHFENADWYRAAIMKLTNDSEKLENKIPQLSVSLWIDHLKAGDRDATEKLWERYFRRLMGLARKRLENRPRLGSDAEDVALSAFDSFFRGAEAGKFPKLQDRDDLWHLRFTPDGHRIVMVSRLNVSVWDDRLPVESMSPEETNQISNAWLRRESILAEQRGLPFGALNHFRFLPESIFENDAMRLVRAGANAQLENWSSAADDFELVARRGAMNYQQLYQAAILRFFSGDEADYDDLCRIYRDRLRNSANSSEVNLMAWAWCIGPHEASELEWIIQKTEASLSMPLPPIEKITMLNTLGALFYRAGGLRTRSKRLRSQ